MTLAWSCNHRDVEYFEIRYRSPSGLEKYKTHRTNDNENITTVTGLKGSTAYVFQVRCVWEEKEGNYSEQSMEVCTGDSLASRLLVDAVQLNEEKPSKYQLYPRILTRNEEKKIKQVRLGKHLKR